MKLNRYFVWALIIAGLISGCGKPNDPAVIDPEEPEDNSGGYKVEKKFLTTGYAQDVIKKDNLLYMAQGEGGLIIIDVNDPENPEIVSVTTEEARGYSTKVAMADSAVYLAAGSFGLTVINAADPVNPDVTLSNVGIKPAKNIHIMGDYMFIAVSEQGIRIAEISYPTQPDPRGGIYTLGYAMGITTSSDSTMLFAACGEMGLSIYDISEFEQGFGDYPRIAWCDTPGHAESVKISEEESLAYLACGSSGLHIIDYSDTTNVHIVGSFDGGGYAKELIYKDQKIYLTAELSGLQVIDVSDASNPQLIGEIDTEFALGVAVDDAYVYLADEEEGLIVISIPE